MKKNGRRRASREHLVPRSRGARFPPDPLRVWEIENAIPLLFVCQECNSDKGDLWIEDWLARLIAANDRRAFVVDNFIRDRPVLMAHCRRVMARLSGAEAATARESGAAECAREELPDFARLHPPGP